MAFLREQGILPEGEVAVFSNHTEVAQNSLFVSIGGDGTVLDSVCLVRDSNVPILGINTGRLGFLSNVSTEEMDEAIVAIEMGDYYLDERTLIKAECAEVDFGDFPFALNEVTVYKHNDASMVTIEAYMGDRYLNTYWADGLIVATPTGSTAYSLSCGGPIMMPGARAFVLTPIAPHNLNVRPLVVPNTSDLRLSADGRSSSHRISLDARPFNLPGNTPVKLTTAAFTIKLLNLNHQHFFQTIRNKMLWGIDKRN
jgi:NAD+ kinase